MDEQITLAGFEPLSHKESLFLDSIFPEFLAVTESEWVDSRLLIREVNKDYSVVKTPRLTSFRLRLRKMSHYIAVLDLFSDMIPKDYPTKRVASVPHYIRILVDQEHPIESYTGFLIEVVRETIKRYPKDWDCCSRYLECSDAKKCIHPNKTVTISCGYRKILRSGRIFYGKNRNVL